MTNINNDGNYKLNTIACENLEQLFRAAISELNKFTLANNAIKRKQANIQNLKQEIEKKKGQATTDVGCIWFLLIVIIGIAVYLYYGTTIVSTNTWFLPVAIGVIVFWCGLYKLTAVSKKNIEKITSNIATHEKQLADLEKQQDDIVKEFTALQFIPEKYSNETALKLMLGYIQDYRASNWERCTDLYEIDRHNGKMEESAERTAEQAAISAKLAAETRNATRSAAAGAWAAAAGIWWR
ncbi:MAG: hypothetical protein LBT25_02595 [Candidatus Symbiothrix sp.]|jgi:ABC-type multidrug transport system fused ATPase/permease subunit|nr:hypothetical protein [Candidatus Symbiothrix sp.]